MSTKQAVPTVTVFGYFYNPDGTPLSGAKIRFALQYDHSYLTSPSVTLNTKDVYATSDSNGYASAALVRNSDITPAGTLYSVQTPTSTIYINVPAGAGPFDIATIQTGVVPTTLATVGHLSSLTVDAGLTVSAGPVSLPAASLSEANVANLTSDLASKASDASVVHLAGAESITGVKTFTANPVLNAGALPLSAVSGAAADSAVVHNTGAETIAGVKTFSSAPVLPANSIADASLSSNVDLLNAAQTITGAKAFTGGIAAGTGASYPLIAGAVTAYSLGAQLIGAGDVYLDYPSTGNLYVRRSGQAAFGRFDASSNVTFNNALTVGNGLTVSAGGATITGAVTIAGASGSLTVAQGITVQTGGATINGGALAFGGSSATNSYNLQFNSNDGTQTYLRKQGAAMVMLDRFGGVQFTFDMSAGLIVAGSGVTLGGAAPTAAAGQVALGGTTATTATAGASGAPPAQVLGYLVANVAGTQVKVPFYAN